LKGKFTDRLEKNAIEKALNKTGLGSGVALDIPCGTGRITELLAKKGFNVVASDISEAMMQHAIERNKPFGDSVKFTKADIEKLEFEDNSFDVVLTIRLIHHVPASLHLSILSGLKRVTRRWVIITCSNKYSFQNLRCDLVSRFTKFPRYSISPSLFRKEVQLAGFNIIAFIPIFPIFSESVIVLLEKQL
jgi:ubiquinone/menaquinone biosynthesis C-methylase UbiE